MKNIVSLLIAMLMLISLTSCGIYSGQPVKTPDSVYSDNIPADTDSAESNGSSVPDVTITETVLLDESGLKITAKNLNLSGFIGPELELLIENNSGKNLTVQCNYSSINGYMIDNVMSVDIADGKKANDKLTFMKSDLKACGIDTIADIEISFHIFTSDDWSTYLDTESIQLKTSAFDGYTYTFDDSGDIAYNENGIKIIVKGLSSDSSLLGPGIVLYIENSGDRDITVQSRNVSVNGFMVNEIFSCDVVSGKHAVDTITFLSSDLENNGISNIDDVELSFHIFDYNSWSTIEDTDTVTISFQ